MGVFTDTSELVDLSRRMMGIIAAGYIAMAVTQSLSGVMRGAGDTLTPMWISLFTTIVVRVPVAYGIAYFTRSAELPNGRQECVFISLLCCHYDDILCARKVERESAGLMGYLLNAFFLCADGCVFFQNYSPAQLVRFLGGYVRGQGIARHCLKYSNCFRNPGCNRHSAQCLCLLK